MDHVQHIQNFVVYLQVATIPQMTGHRSFRWQQLIFDTVLEIHIEDCEIVGTNRKENYRSVSIYLNPSKIRI